MNAAHARKKLEKRKATKIVQCDFAKVEAKVMATITAPVSEFTNAIMNETRAERAQRLRDLAPFEFPKGPAQTPPRNPMKVRNSDTSVNRAAFLRRALRAGKLGPHVRKVRSKHGFVQGFICGRWQSFQSL